MSTPLKVRLFIEGKKAVVEATECQKIGSVDQQGGTTYKKWSL